MAVRVVLASVLAAWCGCLSVIPSEAESGILDEERACSGSGPEESECIVVAAGRCSCSNDGALTAANVAFVDDIEARRREDLANPSGELCRDAISDSETCCATGAACVDGRCELLGPRGGRLASDCANRDPVDVEPVEP